MNGNVSEKNVVVGSGHSLRAVERNAVTIQGVTDVLSFDEDSVCMTTTCGYLMLEGEGLHVTVLNTKDGVVEVTGKLSGLLYEDQDPPTDTKSKGRKSRLFG